MNLPHSNIKKIPSEHKDEFLNKVFKDNFTRMIIIAVLLTIIEPCLAVFTEEAKSASFYLALWIGLMALSFIPILYYFKENTEKVSKLFIMLVQALFLIGILMGGITWSLYEQNGIASSSAYFLAIFTVSAFIVMTPVFSAVLLFASNLVFIMLLPQFQILPDLIITLNVNTLSATAVAWIINRMISREKVNFFINEKLIIDKNLELEKKNTELNELTLRDSMTNLVNHKYSLKKLKEEVDRAKRIGYPLSVAMIDLDNFKLVNDTYGHQTGDEVLIRVAQILSANCRITDTVGRYGGEEFIIIMPDTNDQDAAMMLERIRVLIEETTFAEGIHITLSCGISELNGESVHGILKSSDFMLYEAKKKGKNRVEVLNKTDKKSAAIN